MARPKAKNANIFELKRIPNQEKLQTTTEHYLSQSTIGASTAKIMNIRGVLPDDDISSILPKKCLRKSLSR